MKTKNYFSSDLVGRVNSSDLEQQIDIFTNEEWNQELGDAIPLICLILNARRQVVYANRKVLEHLEIENLQCIYGKRTGELFNCVHVAEGEDGCGTSSYCRNCGSLQAILGAQKGKETVTECRLTDDSGLSSDYRINATPINRRNEKFTIFTLEDIQHEKRRQALERTFFHDLMNSAGGISGLVEVLHLVDDDQEKETLLTLLKKNIPPLGRRN